ncbi:MAG: VTT domain-containing protein [candidate division WOR-3 bacterium]
MPLINRKFFFIFLLLFLLFLLYLSFRFSQRINLSQIITLRNQFLRFSRIAPLLFFLAQVGQIFLPFIPGQILNFAGGYIFGIGFGSILSLLGVLSGSLLAFLLSRRLGRKILKYLLKEKKLKIFDTKIKNSGPFLFFLLFLIPNPLGDALYYLYGLTNLPFSFFLPAVLIGRLPGIVFASYLGAKALSFTSREWLIFGASLIFLTSLFYFTKEKILNLLCHQSKSTKTPSNPE